ncbi:type II restriction endonuclease [Butyrivibrio fibrisolvens]|uniref:type II restriction endonuclease n=1 Tax=Pseudobutyrivibrio ruminis TaxID=46206 RepID=UPI00041CA075|nr:type II restriction endonuclease [Pseudobutyrivibrio ruminis]MDC7280778.1 type II restriction endonuclease [Butyrivibrio fibrisolvens]
MRNFDEWLKTMRPSINQYDYYVDFNKVYENVEAMKVELNIMNSLIGSKNIEEDIKKLIERYPEVIRCIPTLLAVRQTEIYAQDAEGAFNYNFKEMNYSVDQYIVFMGKTGLLDLIANHLINNLVDYCLGIEVGLDSNGRKNRGGHQMEDLVEKYLVEAGVEYYKEMYLTEIEEKWGVDLSPISAEGKSTKRWDFVVKAQDNIYVIETNFYGGGGSKLNETSRSYELIASKMKEVNGVEFIWVTDGGGWKSAKKNLSETFDVLDTLFNIQDMEEGTLNRLFAYGKSGLFDL